MDIFNKKITIGIRAYNVEHYIEQCLDSVYNQTIRDDIQIVIVEDCSTDNTVNIINNWVDTHQSVSVQLYNNFVNKGAGVGLMLLQEYIQNTEYVIMLDGDDFYLKNDCLEYMYNFIHKHGFDFVKFFGEINLIHTGYLIKYNLYKQIKFNPFRFGEDGYGVQLYNLTDNYVLHHYVFYYYRNNGSSLCYNKNKKHPLLSIFSDVYYKNIPEASIRLKNIIPDSEYKDVYNELQNINYEINPAVLVLTKNTNLQEWVTYHLNMGFEHIFVVDNNDLPLTLNNDNVTIIPYNNIQLISWIEF